MQIQGTLKSQDRQYKNTFDASLQIARKEGIMYVLAKLHGRIDFSLTLTLTPWFSSLFSSVNAAILRDAPFAALYYTAYEVMKDVQRWAVGIQEDQPLTPMNNFIGGAVAGAFAAICTNPLDVVKTYVYLTVNPSCLPPYSNPNFLSSRIQTQTSLPEDQRRYKGVIDAVWKIAKQEGLKGFSIGLVPRLLYITPSAAIIWTCYEAYKQMLHRTFSNYIPADH